MNYMVLSKQVILFFMINKPVPLNRFIVRAPISEVSDSSERAQFFSDAISDIAKSKGSETVKKAYKMASGRIRLIITQKQEIPKDTTPEEYAYFLEERLRYAKTKDGYFVVSPPSFVILRFTWEALKWLSEDQNEEKVADLRKNILKEAA